MAKWRREDIPYDAMGDYSQFQFEETESEFEETESEEEKCEDQDRANPFHTDQQ